MAKIERSQKERLFNSAANKAGTDKPCLNHTFAGRNYMDYYAELLLPPKFEPTARLKILEFGVFKGASLRMWASLFPEAIIVGVDKDLRHVEDLARKTRGVLVREGDQADRHFLNSLCNFGPLDLIVDDGSHAYEDMLRTAIHMLPRMSPGGVYVIEDTHVGWVMPTWPGIDPDDTTHPNDPQRMHDFVKVLMQNLDRRTGPIQSIHYYHGMLAFKIADTEWSPAQD